MSLFDVGSLLDSFSASGSAGKGELFDNSRKAWHKADGSVARCDMAPGKQRLNSKGLLFFSLWRRSIYGRTLTEIKMDPASVARFGSEISVFISRLLGDSLNLGDWAIVTPPPRRHPEGNFAQAVARLIAARLDIPFYPDVAAAKSRQRVNAEYSLVRMPPQRNIIVFDDICTTGSTLLSMNRLLRPLGRNLVFVVGIQNH